MSLRWEFLPSLEGSGPSSVRWRWRAWTQAGKLFAESDQAFEMYIDCLDDAKRHGYKRERM